MKTKAITTFLCLLLSVSFSYSQTQSTQEESSQTKTVVVGTKTDGTELTAQHYSFNRRIETFSLSDNGEKLCISFREKDGKYLKNKGAIAFYDVKENKMLWAQAMNFSKTNVAYCISEGVLTYSGNKISLLNKETGQKQWETTLFPIHIDDSLGIMLGYVSHTASKLRAINLKTGEEIWKQKVTHQYGWNQILELEEGNRLIVADELHKLNFTTGEMLTYNGKPGAYDTKAALLQGLAAVAVGVAGSAMSGGGYYYSAIPVANNTITGLNSNILNCDSLYYWADKEHIVCLDTNLNEIWKTEFPDTKGSQSKLFMQNEKLFMINYGYGFRQGGSSRKKYGHPFIACYDPQNGKEIFLNRLSVKKDMVESALLTGNALYLIFDDGVAYQELTDSIVNITPWDTKEYGKLQELLPGGFFAANQDKTVFRPLIVDEEHCLVYSDKGTVYEISRDLSIDNTYKPEQIYGINIELKDYFCVSGKNDHWFIHETGMPIAHLQVGIKKGRVIGNKLLLLDNEHRLLFVDLEEAVE